MTIPLYKGKGECKNYRTISLLSVLGKIYAGMLVDRVCRVTGDLIDNEQGGFRAERCIDKNFPFMQIGEKARERKCSVHGFYRFREGI